MTDVHIVASGETLSGLAATHGISLADLMGLNPQIDDPDLIFVGQPINVPGTPGETEHGPASPATGEPGWLPIAHGELGETEISGPQHNKRIIEYHATTTLKAGTDEVPWCSSFVNWCVEQSGSSGTDSAAARSWTRWGKKLSRPKRGCITVFSSSRGPASGHVGFFIEDRGPHLLILGGNQQNAVNYSSYPKSRLLSHRWSH